MNNRIPEIEGEHEKNLSNKKHYVGLYTKGLLSTDPVKLDKLDEKTLWPAVSNSDIHWFMREHGSVGINRETVTAYKTGKA